MTEAEDLRDLARKIEDLCRAHRANSMAYEAVRALTEYLTLRARVMELERVQVLTPPSRSGTL